MFRRSDTLATTVVTLAAAQHRADVTIIEQPTVAPRPLPAFVLDLSGEALPHHLLYAQAFARGGVVRVE